MRDLFNLCETKMSHYRYQIKMSRFKASISGARSENTTFKGRIYDIKNLPRKCKAR